jgi:SAM-dependent methyltransferase
MSDEKVIDLENFEVPACTLTGKVNHKTFKWGNYHLNLVPPIEVAKCRETGMLYLCPRPNRKNRELMLQGVVPAPLSEYGKKGYNYGSVEELRINDFEKRIEVFNKIFSDRSSPSLLDVGTSGGAFLDVAAKKGWSVKGIEPFVDDVKKCQAKGHDVIVGLAENLPYADNSFDVVHTSHVFEHLENPLAAAKEANRVLKPGGLLFIEVPNQLDNFGFRRDMLFRNVSQRKRGITSIHHLWFFGRKTLSLLLKTSGFSDVVIRNAFTPPAKGWRYPFSLMSHILGNLFYGSYIIRGYAFKK